MKLAGKVVDQLLEYGVRATNEFPYDLHSRTCKHYFVFGVYDVVDLRDMTVAKGYRGRQYFSIFMLMLFQRILMEKNQYAVKLTKVVNTRLEDFIVRLGFRAISQDDYIMLYPDIREAQARLRTILREPPEGV